MVSLNDQGLADDRRVCTMNCHQFNSVAGKGAKELELRPLFSKIIEHGPLVKPKPTEVRYSPGKVGSSASVEAPFFCDFGYNLQIGSSVRIDRNCIIKDFATIVIGDRVQIGANVLLSAQVMPPNALYRGKARGMKIIIGSNCVIGDGVKITSDDPNKRQLRIGDGAYIGAGTHVTQVSAPVIAARRRMPTRLGRSCRTGDRAYQAPCASVDRYWRLHKARRSSAST